MAYRFVIPTDAYFMMGIPGETKQDILKTIAFSKTLKASADNFAIAIPMPKTELFDIAMERGEISASSWNDFDYTGKGIFKSGTLDKKTLEQLRRKAILSFYFSLTFSRIKF